MNGASLMSRCRYPLEQLPEVMKALLDRRVQGKAIITMDQQQQQSQLSKL